MSNFEGIQKNGRVFKPKGASDDSAGVLKTMAGLPYGQSHSEFEKGNNPVLETAGTPKTDGRGESEIGLSGQVDHPNNDGGARYTDPADIIRQSIAQLSGVSGSHSAITALQALADQLEGKSASSFVHKSASHVEVECPHCHGANHVERSTVGGIQDFTCSHCAKWWKQDVGISTFTKSTASSLQQLNDSIEKLRRIMAQKYGVNIDTNSGSDRFVTKAKSTAEAELHKALANGRAVQFAGEDPRTAAEKASGSGRTFQTRR